jgi:mRNA degradation ribonuclease J1/J2
LVVKDAEGLMNMTRRKIVEVVKGVNGNAQRAVEKAVGDFLYSETRRRPTVVVNIQK